MGARVGARVGSQRGTSLGCAYIAEELDRLDRLAAKHALGPGVHAVAEHMDAQATAVAEDEVVDVARLGPG